MYDLAHLSLTLIHLGPTHARTLYHLTHREQTRLDSLTRRQYPEEVFTFHSPRGDQVIPHAHGTDPV